MTFAVEAIFVSIYINMLKPPVLAYVLHQFDHGLLTSLEIFFVLYGFLNDKNHLERQKRLSSNSLLGQTNKFCCRRRDSFHELRTHHLKTQTSEMEILLFQLSEMVGEKIVKQCDSLDTIDPPKNGCFRMATSITLRFTRRF